MKIQLPHRSLSCKHAIQWIGFTAAIWWILLASASLIPLSELQIEWSCLAYVVILGFIPLCIFIGGIIAAASYRNGNQAGHMAVSHPSTQLIFVVLAALFVAHCLIVTPPAFSSDPNDYRLQWGVKYLHVLTEIVLRVIVLLAVGEAVTRQGFVKRHYALLAVALLYTVLVVSRSFMVEILFYWGLGLLFIYAERGALLNGLALLCGLGVMILLIFVLYGNWRQGSNFSIVNYAKLNYNSPALAWFFGYFLANFDNLALVINTGWRNTAQTNVFGPLLSTLKIMPYPQVDDFIYIGRFNLGTGLRSYVVDLGPWLGGLEFLGLWSGFAALPTFCRTVETRYAALTLVSYCAFCLPITGRIDSPPYLFAMLWVVFLGRVRVTLF